MVAIEKRTFRTELERWHGLKRRKSALEQKIDSASELRIRLSMRLTADGIRSTIIQHYDNLDMPFGGSGVGDKTGNLVANTIESEARTSDRLLQWQQEYLRLCDDLVDIECEVNALGERYQQIVIAFYRDRTHWAEICRVCHIEKSRMYEMLDEAVEQIDNVIRMFEG